MKSNTPIHSVPSRPEGNIPSADWNTIKSNAAPVAIMRLPQLREVVQQSRSTIYAKMNPRAKQYDPNFPKPIRLSASASGRGSVGWLEHEVQAYLHLCAKRSRVVADGARVLTFCMGASDELSL